MRFPRLLPALLLVSACAEPSASDADEDLCGVASRVHSEEMAEALAAAPACERDADCVVMVDRAGCRGVVSYEGCERAVHRLVPELYDAQEVTDRVCDAVEGAEFGCSLSASCAAHGEPRCVAGECQFGQVSP